MFCVCVCVRVSSNDPSENGPRASAMTIYIRVEPTLLLYFIPYTSSINEVFGSDEAKSDPMK